MRMAYFSPVNPQRTGITDYSESGLLPYLSQYFLIDIFIDINLKPSNNYLLEKFDIYPYTKFEEMKDLYDVSVYHMGNNCFHEYIYQTIIKIPGIVVFHDIFLHDFLWNQSVAKGDINRYLNEFTYCYGNKGTEIAEMIIKNGILPSFEYPLIKRILDNSLGIVCQNDFSIRTVSNEKSDIIITKINQPMPISDSIIHIDNINAEKNQLKNSLSKKTPIIVSFGYIALHKRYNIILKTFKKFLVKHPNAILLLVGEDLMKITDLIETLKLKKSVFLTGFIPYHQTINYLSIADFCINLRYPTAGETSASVLQIMAAKKPVIVSDIGWFSEIPSDCCLKVPVDMDEEDILLAYMDVLTINKEMRKKIGENALNWIEREHNPEKIAFEFYQFIHSIVTGNELLINTVSDALLEMGIDEHDEDSIRNVSKIIQSIVD